LVAGEDAEIHEAPADSADVTELAIDVEALREARPSLGVVAALVGESARRVQRLRPGGGSRLRFRQREDRGHPLPVFRGVSAAAPEAPERATQPQAVIGGPVPDVPDEGGAEVVVVVAQAFQPLDLPCSAQQARLGALRDLEITVGVSPLESL